MLPKFIKVFPHEYKRVLGMPRSSDVTAAASGGSADAAGGDTWVKSPASWNTRGSCRSGAPAAERINDWFEIYQPFPEDNCARRARAAWIAACPSAIPAAR